MTPVLAFIFNAQTVFDGAVFGLTYGMLAAGLVLVYRSSGIISFAYAEIGAFAAALLAVMVLDWSWPFLPALLVVTLVGALMSAVVELTVVRRLKDAPRVIVLIATVGVAQLVLVCRISLPSISGFGRFPSPFEGSWDVLGVTVRGDQLLVVLVVPVLVAALGVFLTRTLTGTAIRGAAANAEASRLMGIDVRLLSTLVWTIAGALAAVATVIIRPLQGFSVSSTDQALDAKLLVVGLAASLVGRFRSLPVALAAGVGIGVVERVLLLNNPSQPGLISFVLLALVLVMAFRVPELVDRSAGRWSFSAAPRALTPREAQRWSLRNLGRIGITLGFLAAVALPFVITLPSRQQTAAEMLIFALLALSATILTGWAGQLSLGQFAIAGVGAFTTAAVMRGGGTFFAALAVATVVGALTAVAVGLPALRVRGILLAVTTLAFALFAQAWLLDLDLFDGGRPSIRVPRVIEAGIDLGPQRNYYWFCLALLAVAVWIAARVRRRGLGRQLIAVRENEQGAAALTVGPARTKLVAFALAGAMAGLAGALYAGLIGRLDVTVFSPETSIQVVAIAVIGGVTSVLGAVIGAIWVVGLPALLGDSSEVKLLTSGIGLLVLLMYFPGGLVQIVYAGRNALVGLLGRGLPDVAPTERPPIPARPASSRRPVPPDAPVLRTDQVCVTFGGNHAVDHVDLEVRSGEIVGLIGANGAGKTTLMNAVGGFLPCTGQVWLEGRDVSGLAPARRAELGLGRAFQNAELFPDLTVHETVQLALERAHPSSTLGVLLGLPGARRREHEQQSLADELVAFFGLGRYARNDIGELSTGTRRITELACLLALDASVLCLDEPTAGVAQKETEAFGPLLHQIRSEFDLPMLIIEHDMPLVLGVSDRVYCLEAGRVIAEGLPADVRGDSAVVASYLGTDERTILRSGSL